MAEPHHESPARTLRRLANGYQVSQAIHVAATLGVADALADGPRSANELASVTGSHPEALYRVLRALAALGVLHEDPARTFALTEVGECLRTDAPEPVAGWAAFVGRPAHWQSWGHLLHSVRTGENAFRDLHGQDVWQFRETHPEEQAFFDAAMTAGTRAANAALLERFDFGSFGTLVDVGGGQGALLAAVLGAHPSLRGVLFDLPQVVAGAQPLLAAAGVSDRCRVVAGSFFESVPEGGDAYVLKAIVHDWEDDDATRILESCRRAIRPDGTLLVVERLLAPPNEGAEVKLGDLNMLVGPGGRERTLEEFAHLFERAGFRLGSHTPTRVGFSVIAAQPRVT